MADTAERKLRVFLCHASHDKPAVRELYQRLKAEGWIDPWLDEENLFPGWN
ncbi:MAG: TIR domain-containing protein [Chloroflexota bacterium]